MDPELIKIKGFLPFLEETVIDLRKVHTALTIGQIDDNDELSMGAGKSAWIEAIDVCFFGKSAGRCNNYDLYIHDDIRGTKDQQFEIEVIFKMQNVRYRKRRYHGKKALNEFDVDQNSGELEEAVWEAYTGDSSYDTDAKLVEVLGLTHRTYKSVVHLSQKESTAFIEDSGSRKEILRELLGVEEYDRLSNVCNDEASDKGKEVEVERRVISEKEEEYEQNFEENDKKLEKFKKEVSENGKTLKTRKKSFEESRKEFEKFEASLGNLEEIKEQIDLQHEKLQDIRKEIGYCEEQIDETAGEIERLKEELAEEKENLKSVADQLDSNTKNIEVKKAQIENYKELLGEFDKLEKQRNKQIQERDKLNTKVSDVKSEIKRIEQDTEDLKEATNCPILKTHCDLITGENREKEIQSLNDKCNKAEKEKIEFDKQFTTIKNGIEKTEEQLDDLRTKESRIGILEKEIKLLASEVEKCEKAQIEYEKLDETYAKKEEQRRERIEERSKKKKEYEGQIPQIEKKLKELEKKIQEYDENELERLKEVFEAAKQDLEEIEEELNESRVQKQVTEKEIGRLKKIKKDVEERSENIEDQLKDIIVFERLAFAFGKNGCQKMIMKNAVPNIETEANKLLKKFSVKSGHSVRFDLDPLTKDGVKRKRGGLEIFVTNMGGKEKPIESYSGGETEKITLSIILALSRSLTKRAGKPIDTLFIDEKFSFMDGPNKSQLIEILESVASLYKKVIVVSHLAELKAAFDKYIIVKKVGNRSTVEIA